MRQLSTLKKDVFQMAHSVILSHLHEYVAHQVVLVLLALDQMLDDQGIDGAARVHDVLQTEPDVKIFHILTSGNM